MCAVLVSNCVHGLALRDGTDGLRCVDRAPHATASNAQAARPVCQEAEKLQPSIQWYVYSLRRANAAFCCSARYSRV